MRILIVVLLITFTLFAFGLDLTLNSNVEPLRLNAYEPFMIMFAVFAIVFVMIAFHSSRKETLLEEKHVKRIRNKIADAIEDEKRKNKN